MILRIDYKYTRGFGNSEYNYEFIEAPKISKKSQLIDHLRRWAEKWTGKAKLQILEVSESFKNEMLETLSDQIQGQVIEINEGKAVFKNNKKSPD